MKRIDLYNMVWARPVMHVSKEFGISDVALRKICVKHGVPIPPLGYWAKLQHGKKVKQTPLPPLKERQRDEVDLHLRLTRPIPPEVTEARESAIREEAKEEARIAVPAERPAKLHKVAAATEKALCKAKPDGEGFITAPGSETPDVYIGRGSIDRAVLLLHTFLQAALDRGHRVVTDPEFRILVDEQPLAIRIYEGKSKAPHVPTSAELKAQAEADESRARWGQKTGHKVYRAWDYSPSGALSLEISDPLLESWQSDRFFDRWRDRSSKRLEEYLSEMMVALKTGGAAAQVQRAKEAEAARLAKEAEERRREQEIQRRLLERATKFLTETADKHELLLKIERLANYLRVQGGDSEHQDGTDLDRVLEFVLANLRHQLSPIILDDQIKKTRLLDPNGWY